MLRLRSFAGTAGLLRTKVALVRLCSSAAVGSVSKKKAFKSVPLDMSIMNKLDTINVGLLPHRKMRVAVAKKLDPHNVPERRSKATSDNSSRSLPFPFYLTGKVLHTATDGATIPPPFPGSPPEIALVGRSNVGKSTLMNALLRFDKSYVQKAIVSDKPGETKNLTFFQLGESFKPPKGPPPPITEGTKLNKEGKPWIDKTPALMLVDMPGYGFAFMSPEDKHRSHFLCLDYLVSNMKRDKVLKRVVLLLDGRHGLKATDALFLQDLQRHLLDAIAKGDFGEDSIEAARILATRPQDTHSQASLDPSVNHADDAPLPTATSYALTGKNIKMLSRYLGWKLQIVLTKCDLVDRVELCRRISTIADVMQERVPALYHSMLPTLALSAKQARGVEELQRDLAALVPPIWEGAPNYYKPPEGAEAKKLTGRGEGGQREDGRLTYEERCKQRELEAAAAAKKEEIAQKQQQREQKVAAKEDAKQAKGEGKGPKVPQNKADKLSKDTREGSNVSVTKSSKSNNKDAKENIEGNNGNKKANKKKPSTDKKISDSEDEDDTKKPDRSALQTPSDAQQLASLAQTFTKQDTPKKEVAAPASRKVTKILSFDSDVDDDLAAEAARASHSGGRARRPKPVRNAGDKSGKRTTDRDLILSEYADDLENYFEGRLDGDEDADDVGVNWRAAGEYDDGFSDEEEEELARAALEGTLGQYRNTPYAQRALAHKPIPRTTGRGMDRRAGKLAEEERDLLRSRRQRGSGGGSSGGGAGGPSKSAMPKVKVNVSRVPKTEHNPKGRHIKHNPRAVVAAAAGKGGKAGASGKRPNKKRK